MSKLTATIGRDAGYPALFFTNLSDTQRDTLYGIMFENDKSRDMTHYRSEAGAFVHRWHPHLDLYVITLRGEDQAAIDNFINKLEVVLNLDGFVDAVDMTAWENKS